MATMRRTYEHSKLKVLLPCIQEYVPCFGLLGLAGSLAEEA